MNYIDEARNEVAEARRALAEAEQRLTNAERKTQSITISAEHNASALTFTRATSTGSIRVDGSCPPDNYIRDKEWERVRDWLNEVLPR